MTVFAVQLFNLGLIAAKVSKLSVQIHGAPRWQFCFRDRLAVYGKEKTTVEKWLGSALACCKIDAKE
jgi:hypothetical protein